MQRPTRTLLVVALAVATAAGCTEAAARGGSPAEAAHASEDASTWRGRRDGADLVLLTHNVNFERPSAVTARALRATGADVIVLQETTAAWEPLLRAGLEEYDHVAWMPAEDEGGAAVFSRLPITSPERRPSPVEGGFPAYRFEVQTDGGDVRVLAVHLRPPLDDEGRLIVGYFTTGPLRERELRAHLEGEDPLPDVVLGDLNEAEGPAVERLDAAGLREAQRAFGPPAATWRWDSAIGELTGRPDHVFVGPRLRIIGVQAGDGGASDHRPVLAALRWRRP